MAVGRRPIFGEQQRFMLFLIAPAALLMLLFLVFFGLALFGLRLCLGADAPRNPLLGLRHLEAALAQGGLGHGPRRRPHARHHRGRGHHT